MLPKIIEELLAGEDCDCGNCTDDMLTPERVDALLALGMNPNGLIVGDSVVRTELGKFAVKFPREEIGQKAIILAVYPEYRFDENGSAYNAVIDIAVTNDIVKTFPADLRHYTKAS